MKNKNLIIVGILIIIFILLITIFKQDYKRFNWDGDKCITYTQDCICLGLSTVLESYPPKYICKGFEKCENINITECGE